MRVKRSPYMRVESQDGEQVYVCEHRTGNRAVVNARTLAFLDRLRDFTDLSGDSAGVERLLDLGLLVEEGREARPLDAKVFSRVLPAFFGCPAWRPDEPSDFVLVGVPFDGGNRTAPGARYGPDALRQASVLYPMAVERPSGASAGWVDHDTEERILAGARLRDAGEVYLRAGAGEEENGQRITEAVKRIAASGARPIVVGGDHSITFAAVRGLPAGRLGILHLDAHSDAAPHFPGLAHDYGSVISRLVDELEVAAVVHAGVRGLGQGDYNRPPVRRAVSPRWLRSHTAEDLLALLDPALAWYVSVDIDVVDPAFAPGTATPVPAGLTVEETKDLLRTAGRLPRVVGGDLVEVNPHFDHNHVTASLGCELLLTLMGAVARTGR